MRELINQTLKKLIPTEDGILFEAAHYSLEGGKRLRPLITLAVVETFGKEIEKGLYPACALEMIHTYSLIHDDLPCMDDDDFRRGKPSLHRAYPESHAVLTGDFLLTYAFEVLVKAPHLSEAEKNRLVTVLALRAGSKGMIGGQVMDIEGENLRLEDLITMHIKKTAALITAAFEFGGIIAGQDDLTPFRVIGEHLGLAYQIIDDILDGDGATLILGFKEAEDLAHSHFEKAFRIIETLPNGAPRLALLAKEMIFRSV